PIADIDIAALDVAARAGEYGGFGYGLDASGQDQLALAGGSFHSDYVDCGIGLGCGYRLVCQHRLAAQTGDGAGERGRDCEDDDYKRQRPQQSFRWTIGRGVLLLLVQLALERLDFRA